MRVFPVPVRTVVLYCVLVASGSKEGNETYQQAKSYTAEAVLLNLAAAITIVFHAACRVFNFSLSYHNSNIEQLLTASEVAARTLGEHLAEVTQVPGTSPFQMREDFYRSLDKTLCDAAVFKLAFVKGFLESLDKTDVNTAAMSALLSGSKRPAFTEQAIKLVAYALPFLAQGSSFRQKFGLPEWSLLPPKHQLRSIASIEKKIGFTTAKLNKNCFPWLSLKREFVVKDRGTSSGSGGASISSTAAKPSTASPAIASPNVGVQLALSPTNGM